MQNNQSQENIKNPAPNYLTQILLRGLLIFLISKENLRVRPLKYQNSTQMIYCDIPQNKAIGLHKHYQVVFIFFIIW
jgi:hypothetical protein